MSNVLYEMMINNFRAYLKTIDTNNSKPDPDAIDVFRISEVLAIGTGKLKEDIVLDIFGLPPIDINNVPPDSTKSNFYLEWFNMLTPFQRLEIINEWKEKTSHRAQTWTPTKIAQTSSVIERVFQEVAEGKKF